MTREQAEATAKTMANLVSGALQPVMNQFDVIEKRLKWITIESLVAITVIGAGFIGVIIAILQ